MPGANCVLVEDPPNNVCCSAMARCSFYVLSNFKRLFIPAVSI